jgi:hypothetical protein
MTKEDTIQILDLIKVRRAIQDIKSVIHLYGDNP